MPMETISSYDKQIQDSFFDSHISKIAQINPQEASSRLYLEAKKIKPMQKSQKPTAILPSVSARPEAK